MPRHYTHPETEGLRVRLQHDEELASSVKIRANSMLLLICDMVYLQLGTEPHAGTPEQQSLRERARALFLSLGLGSTIGDDGADPPPGESPPPELPLTYPNNDFPDDGE